MRRKAWLPFILGCIVNLFVVSGVQALEARSSPAHSTKSINQEENKYIKHFWVSTGFFSYHPGPVPTGATYSKYNNNNYGLGIESDLAKLGKFVAGNYKNSVYERSNYFGVMIPFDSWYYSNIRIAPGLVIGEIDGYPGYNNGQLSPLLLPVIAIDGSKFGANLVYVPPVGASSAFSLQFKVKIF